MNVLDNPLLFKGLFDKNTWPKIQGSDAEGLRHYSDFLNTCLEAMPHVKGLEILNDCEENQKLISKLPDWVVLRWNRQVTQNLMESEVFPSFKDFVSFLTLESTIACNPVTSIYALRPFDKGSSSAMRKPKATVLTSYTSANHWNSTSVRQRHPCPLCRDNRHHLSVCTEFMNLSLLERRTFVKENSLCYGCLEMGHGVRNCLCRLICSQCNGRHPTALHNVHFGSDDSVNVNE